LVPLLAFSLLYSVLDVPGVVPGPSPDGVGVVSLASGRMKTVKSLAPHVFSYPSYRAGVWFHQLKRKVTQTGERRLSTTDYTSDLMALCTGDNRESAVRGFANLEGATVQEVLTSSTSVSLAGCVCDGGTGGKCVNFVSRTLLYYDSTGSAGYNLGAMVMAVLQDMAAAHGQNSIRNAGCESLAAAAVMEDILGRAYHILNNAMPTIFPFLVTSGDFATVGAQMAADSGYPGVPGCALPDQQIHGCTLPSNCGRPPCNDVTSSGGTLYDPATFDSAVCALPLARTCIEVGCDTCYTKCVSRKWPAAKWRAEMGLPLFLLPVMHAVRSLHVQPQPARCHFYVAETSRGRRTPRHQLNV